jgi:hypothetical protein
VRGGRDRRAATGAAPVATLGLLPRPAADARAAGERLERLHLPGVVLAGR